MSRLYWSNLPDAKRPRGGTSGLWSSLTTEDLPIPEYPETSTKFRPAAGYDAVEGRKQRLDLGCSPVQFLGNQQPVRRVVFAKREFVDATTSFPFLKAAPKVGFQAGCRLVSLLSGLGEQLHDDCRDRSGTAGNRSPGGTGCRAIWQCTHSIGSEAVKGRLPSTFRKA